MVKKIIQITDFWQHSVTVYSGRWGTRCQKILLLVKMLLKILVSTKIPLRIIKYCTVLNFSGIKSR